MKRMTNKEKRKKIEVELYGILIVGFVVGLVVIGLMGWLGEQSDKTDSLTTSTPETPLQVQPQTQTEKVVMPQYIVLKEDIIEDVFGGVLIKTQAELSIIVSGEISENGLRALLNELYPQMQQRRGSEYQKNPTHIVIYAYTSEEHAESGMGQWIAMLFKKIGDSGEPEIRFNEYQMAQIGANPEEKFGLSEAQRKQIWSEIVKAEDRTTTGKLSEKDKTDLAKKFGLTLEQLDEIRIEGLTKDWPFPKYERN